MPKGLLLATGTFAPRWKDLQKPRYLVLHYELLQLPQSEAPVRQFVTAHPDLDFCVADEMHLSKVRNPRALSLRRQRLNLLSTLAAQHNSQLAFTAFPYNSLVMAYSYSQLDVWMYSGSATVRPALKVLEHSATSLTRRFRYT